jgi:hypothetical protein
VTRTVGSRPVIGYETDRSVKVRYGASTAAEGAIEAHRRVDPLGDVL